MGKEISLEQNRYFTTVSSSSMRTVAGRHRLAEALLTTFPEVPKSMPLSDLETEK